MANITIFLHRWLREPGGLGWRRACVTATLLSFFILTGVGIAAKGDSTAGTNSKFNYQPFSEAEIKTALQKPLTLDDCIRIALRMNLPLRVAEGDLARAEATHEGSHGQFFPVFTLESMKSNTLLRERKTIAPDTVALFVDSSFDNNALFVGAVQQYLPTGATVRFSTNLRRNVNIPLVQSARGIGSTSPKFDPTSKLMERTYEINITQPLLRGAWPKIARSAVTSTEYDRQSREKQLFNAKLQTVFSVKSAFYNVLLQRELIKVNETAVKNDSLLVKSSEAMVTAKLATRRDILSAGIRLAEDRASLISSQSKYQLALDLLKEVMGLPIEASIEVADAGLSYSPITLNEEALIRTALQNNPMLHSAEFAIRRSALDLSVAKNSLLPQLDLVASYTPNLVRDRINNVDLSRSGGWQASLNLSYSFLSREAAGKAENAQIAHSQEQDRLVILQRQIILSIRDIVRSVYSSIEEINAIERSIEVAQEKLAFASSMFSLGRASNLDITDAQEALLRAQNQYFRKVVDYHTQLALLESLTGQPVTQ